LIRAAGGVVLRGGQVLVVHRARYDDWTLPKGKLEPGEDWAEAALREVLEETGFECELGEQLGVTTYAVAGREKEVRWFRMTPKRDSGDCDGEVDELRWLTVDDAIALLSYNRDRKLLETLL
jgi:8-oxo-dGTP diphosphatase